MDSHALQHPSKVAEVVQLDVTIEEGKVQSYRAKVKLSFKYESGG